MGPTLSRILVVGSFAPSLINFRGRLLRDLVAAGHRVTAIAPRITTDIQKQLQQWDVSSISLELARASMNPAQDWLYYRNLRNIFKSHQPHVVLAYTHKPVVYSALAARVVPNARVYGLITGLGYAFADSGSKALKQRLARTMLCWLYRRARTRWNGLMFQNPDDQALFGQHALALPETPQRVVRGSGIDLQLFRRQELPQHPGRVLLIARLLRDKGIREYVEAARIVRKQRPDTEFNLAGPLDPNPAAITASELKAWEREGVIRYHGSVADVRALLGQCTIYALPSYREGTPRTVLEAMATGRAVITTDTAGCRETIFEPGVIDSHRIRRGLNGLLVPIRDASALASGIIRLVESRETIVQMSAHARRLVEAHYGVDQVNTTMMMFMGLPTGDNNNRTGKLI